MSDYVVFAVGVVVSLLLGGGLIATIMELNKTPESNVDVDADGRPVRKVTLATKLGTSTDY